MHKQYTPIEYLCIDIANNFGLDKELFSTRIQWVKDNYNRLEELTESATEDKVMYIKSVMALRTVVRGEATGHLISLDSTCSGMQILSALTGCKAGARITNLTSENQRFDAYTEVTTEQNRFLELANIHGLQISRKDAKQAVMTSLYGSKAEPRNIFGEDTPELEAFYEAAYSCAPGAFSMLDTMLAAWQPYALNHYWKMPDLFDAAIKVMESKDVRIEIDEFNHHKFKTSYKENIGTKSGISLAANITHSVDAYLLRTLIRRCSYKPKQVKRVKALLEEYMNSRVVKVEEIQPLLNQAKDTGIIDTVWFSYINETNVVGLPKQAKQKLLAMADKMLEHKPFSVLTVHDAFRIHPNNGNVLRYWYKEIMAELAESDLLSNILSQITGETVFVRKLSRNLAEEIRRSNYAVC